VHLTSYIHTTVNGSGRTTPSSLPARAHQVGLRPKYLAKFNLSFDKN